MAFVRALAARGAYKAVRPLRTSVGRPQPWRQIGRRGYASHGEHETKQAGGDLPWLIGAVAVTAPSVWYLMKPGEGGDHGHDDHGDGHGKGHSDNHKEESKAEPATESNGDNKDDENSDDSDSGDEGKEAETPETSDDEGDDQSKPKDKQNKSKQDEEKSGSPAVTSGTKQIVPDAKGANKKRIESEKGMPQGKSEDLTDSADESKDVPAASKSAKSQNIQSGKQEGLSNTDTKTSIDLTNTKDQSRKGEGTPESAKSKGTVDSKRPQAETNIGKK